MKKNLKRLAALGVSLILLASPVYATESKPVLTLETTIASAYTYSDTMSLNGKKNDVLKENLKAKEDSTYYNYYSTYLQKAKNEQQKSFIQDQIAYDITSRYNNLVLLEKEIAQLDASIAVKTDELNSQKLKKELGMVSSLDYANTQVELDKLKNTKSSKLETLNNESSYFKLLTGKDLKHYTLDDTLKFETFRIPGSIDSYIKGKTETQLKYDTEMAQLSANNIIKEGDQPVSLADYLDSKYQADEVFSGLKESKKNIQQSITSSYASLLSQEEQIGTTKAQLGLAKKTLEKSQLQYKLGNGTLADCHSKALSVQDLEYTLRSSINQYNSFKNKIENPWAA